MIGILVLTHGELAQQFLETARLIGLQSEEGVMALSLNPAQSQESFREQLAQSVKKLNAGSGVLILTDMFGGTPTNFSMAYLKDDKIKVVTGLNLPMIVRAINARERHDVVSLAKSVEQAGKDSIFLAENQIRARDAKRTAGPRPA